MLDESDDDAEFDTEPGASGQQGSGDSSAARGAAVRRGRRSSVVLPEEEAILQGASPRVGGAKHASDSSKQILLGTCVLHVGVAVFGHRLFAAAAAEEVTQRAQSKQNVKKRSLQQKAARVLNVFGARGKGGASKDSGRDGDSVADGASTASGSSRGDTESEVAGSGRAPGAPVAKSAMERRSITIQLGDVPQCLPVHPCSDPHSNVFGPALAMGDVASRGGAVALASVMPVGFTTANGGVPEISAHNWVELAARADAARARRRRRTGGVARPAALDTWLPLRPSPAVLEAL